MTSRGPFRPKTFYDSMILNSGGRLGSSVFCEVPSVEFRDLHVVWGKVTFNSTPGSARHCLCENTACEGVRFHSSSDNFLMARMQPNSWSTTEGIGQIRNPWYRVMLVDSKNSTGQKKGIQVHSFRRPEMPVKLKSRFCFALSPPTFSRDVLLFSAASLLL